MNIDENDRTILSIFSSISNVTLEHSNLYNPSIRICHRCNGERHSTQSNHLRVCGAIDGKLSFPFLLLPTSPHKWITRQAGGSRCGGVYILMKKKTSEKEVLTIMLHHDGKLLSQSHTLRKNSIHKQIRNCMILLYHHHHLEF